MRFEKVLVTPEVAQNWLSFNKANRHMRPKTVTYYMKEMKEGRWKEDTGETIKFDPENNLLDGQHRLQAIVKSNTTLSLWVAYDVSPESFKVIDAGLKRNTADIFQTSGIAHYASLPVIIRYYNYYKLGKMSDVRVSFSSQECLELYSEKPIFWQECAKNAARWQKAFRPIPISVWGCVGSVLVEIHNDQAMDFLDKLSSGRGIEHDGMFFIRDKFIAESTSASKTRTEYKIALIFKFWNSLRSGNVLKLPRFDPFKEDFPKAR